MANSQELNENTVNAASEADGAPEQQLQDLEAKADVRGGGSTAVKDTRIPAIGNPFAPQPTPAPAPPSPTGDAPTQKQTRNLGHAKYGPRG
jgi:hypothetical protein